MKRVLTATIIIVLTLVCPFGTNAQSSNEEALSEITKTANAICHSIPLKSSAESAELSGDAKAKLDGLVGKVVDLGITGAGKYQKNSSMGLLQKDLAEAIKNGDDCKQSVFNTLQAKLLQDTAAIGTCKRECLKDKKQCEKDYTASVDKLNNENDQALTRCTGGCDCRLIELSAACRQKCSACLGVVQRASLSRCDRDYDDCKSSCTPSSRE